MPEKELTKKRICFVLYGYEASVLALFDKLVPFYEEKGYPLKSVRYDFLKDKNYRDEKLSILKFQEKRKKIDYNTAKNYSSFNIFLADKQAEPLTRHYSISYNEKTIILMFDSVYGKEDIMFFFKETLSFLLKDTTASLG